MSNYNNSHIYWEDSWNIEPKSKEENKLAEESNRHAELLLQAMENAKRDREIESDLECYNF